MNDQTAPLEEQLRRAARAAEELRLCARRVAIEADHLRFARLFSTNPHKLSPYDLRKISRESDEAVHLLGLAAHVSKHAMTMLRRIEKEAEASVEV